MSDRPTENTMPDTYDRAWGQLDGLKSVAKSGPSIQTVSPPFGIGGILQYVVTTIRQREPVSGSEDKTRARDTIFIAIAGGDRYVIPPSVADLIARQRDALTTMVRKRSAKAAAAKRKAAKGK